MPTHEILPVADLSKSYGDSNAEMTLYEVSKPWKSLSRSKYHSIGKDSFKKALAQNPLCLYHDQQQEDEYFLNNPHLLEFKKVITPQSKKDRTTNKRTKDKNYISINPKHRSDQKPNFFGRRI